MTSNVAENSALGSPCRHVKSEFPRKTHQSCYRSTWMYHSSMKSLTCHKNLESRFFFCLKTIFFCLFILREALLNLLQRQVHVEIGCRFRGLKLMSRMHCYDFAMVDCDSFVTSSPIHFERHKASQPRATAITCGKTVKSISSCSYVICLSGVQEFMRMRDHKNVRKKESERVRERESRTLIWNTLLCNWTIKTNLFKNRLSFRLNNYFLLQQSWRVWRYET